MPAFEIAPSGEMRPSVVWIYASGCESSGDARNDRMLRRCCCATAVPTAPMDVPMTALGLPWNAFSP